jgi:predicted DCC family thiol-disulfide oxidoreductase YuxK
MTIPAPIAIVFDGQCAFCLRSLRWLQRFDRHAVMRLYDSHDTGRIAATFPMLAGADFENAMFAVTADGRVFRGYFAVEALLRAMPAPWPLLLPFRMPGVSAIGSRLYALVARNRRRLGCATEVCELPAPPVPRSGARTR